MTKKPENPINKCYYARWFSAEEKRFLKKSSPDGCDEIANLRTFAGRLTRHLSRREPAEYSDDDLKLLTTLVRLSAGIGTLQRGNATIQNREGDVEKSIEEAIQEANRLDGLDDSI
jgi:hypothetical protein